jgi:O-methyltransferase involved in polyketide biosynthesis
MLTGIPATSLWALRAKAEEHGKNQGLFRDSLAAKWYHQAQPFFTPEINAQYSKTLQKSIAIRTDILDQLVKQHFQRHPTGSLLELGCGFSTRFTRLNLSEGQWYELDLPEIVELRASMGFPKAAQHWHIASSVFDYEWLDYLAQEPAEKMLILAEGLFMYFPLSQVRQLLIHLQNKFSGAQIAFDVMGILNLKAAQRAALEIDSPIYWGAKDMRTICPELGLTWAGDLSLSQQMQANKSYQKGISILGRSLLRWSWLSNQLGGTVLAQL